MELLFLARLEELIVSVIDLKISMDPLTELFSAVESFSVLRVTPSSVLCSYYVLNTTRSKDESRE